MENEEISAELLFDNLNAETVELDNELGQLSTVGLNCELPSKIKDLRAGTTFKLYKFDQDLSASASAMGFSGTIGRKEMVLIQDFNRFDFVMCDGIERKVGIGLRCFMHVQSFKGKLEYVSPAGIAASVQLDRAKCTYELISLGFPIDGRVLANDLEPQGDYNVENFGKLAVAFNNVLSLLNDDNLMVIRPVPMP